MMLKAQKIEYVKKLQEEMKKYNVVGVMPINAIPDRLLQKVRNGIKPEARIIIARKSLMLKALEQYKEYEQLKKYVTENSALIFANGDVFDIYKRINSNKLKLAAKPNQIAPEDIYIESGETTIQPGQAVTDLKAAGIDVQIQKGKVVIAKSKVLVQKGQKIGLAVTKALKMLGVTPFEVSPKVSGFVSGGLMFTQEILSINPEQLGKEIVIAFATADILSTEIGYVTQYNISKLLRKGYLGALGLGIATKSYEPGIVEMLIAQAVREAMGMPKPKEPEPEPTPAATPTGEQPIAPTPSA